jgi:hypothetical protein
LNENARKSEVLGLQFYLNVALLDEGKEDVLLRFIEAVHFIKK